MEFENLYSTLISGYMVNGVLNFNLDILFDAHEMKINNCVFYNDASGSSNWLFKSTLPTKYTSILFGISNINTSYQLNSIKELYKPIQGQYSLTCSRIVNGVEVDMNAIGWIYISVSFYEYKKSIPRPIENRHSSTYLLTMDGVNNVYPLNIYIPFDCDTMILKNYVYYNAGAGSTQAILSTTLPFKYTDKLLALTNQSVNYAFNCEYELSNPTINGTYNFIFTSVLGGVASLNGFLYLNFEFLEYNKKNKLKL
jgi:hypothetical protein